MPQDEDDFLASMTGLSGLLSGSGALETTLVRVAHLAVQAIPNAEGEGTFGSSDQFSRTLDELQFTYGQGPCLDSADQAPAQQKGQDDKRNHVRSRALPPR